MKVEYYNETDTLYIVLQVHPGADTVHASEDVTIDIDNEGKPVGIEIENASRYTNLDKLELSTLPAVITEAS